MEEGSGGAVTLQDQEAWSIALSEACEQGGGCHEDACAPTQMGASFDAAAATAASGAYTGRTKHHLTFDEVWEASTDFWQAQCAQTPCAEEPESLSQSPLPAQPRQAGRSEISLLDRYRLKLAMMSETHLAGELKKHRYTLRKHAGKLWLTEIERRVRAVEAEIDYRIAPPLAHEAAPLSQALPSVYQQPLFVVAPP